MGALNRKLAELKNRLAVVEVAVRRSGMAELLAGYDEHQLQAVARSDKHFGQDVILGEFERRKIVAEIPKIQAAIQDADVKRVEAADAQVELLAKLQATRAKEADDRLRQYRGMSPQQLQAHARELGPGKGAQFARDVIGPVLKEQHQKAVTAQRSREAKTGAPPQTVR